MNKQHLHPKPCEYCGTLFTRREKERPNVFVKRRFCSYKCSTLAVQSVPIADLRDRFLQKVTKAERCWIWSACKANNGYGKTVLHGKPLSAHVASYRLFKGDVPKGMVVMHKCDNPSCVNPEHLVLGTPKDNVDDMLQKGRQCCGESRANSQLKSWMIPEIIRSNEKHAQIARRLGVSATAVSFARKGRTWKHITRAIA